MAIIIKRDDLRILKTQVKELTYTIKCTPTGTDMQVDLFEIVNDNLPNCPAHIKCLRPEEMYAVYEYMKKVVEGA